MRAEEVGHSKKVLKLTCNGIGLDKKDLFGKSDPYLELARENRDGTFSIVHKTIVSARACFEWVGLLCHSSVATYQVLSAMSLLPSLYCIMCAHTYVIDVNITSLCHVNYCK